MDATNITDYSNIKIQDLNISVRLKNVLLQNGILFFNQLLECPNESIRNFRNAGSKTLEEAIYLKNNPDIIENLLISEDEIELGNFEKVKILEEKIDNDFINNIYSDFTYKDFDMSIRLKNCLYSNKINTVPLFLETPIEEIKTFSSLGKKSLEEAIDIKLKLLDLNDAENTSNILYLFIKKITNEEAKSVIYIKNYLLQKTNYNIEKFVDDLNKLKNENKIELSMDGIKVKKISVMDYINSLDDEKRKNIMTMRLNGSTLEEIGTKEGVTRERIRQISTKFLAGMPDVKESKYKNIFEKYSFSENEFCKIFNESKTTYYYLKLACDSGNVDIIDGLDNIDFNENQKNIIRKLKNIVNIFGKNCNGSKNEVVKILSEEYAFDGITFEDFTKIYNNFVRENNDVELELSDERSIEGILGRQDNIIFDFGRRFRYVDLSLLDKSIINKLNDVIDLEDGYYSTLVIFNDNQDLMKELDIRNEYELHSFLKKKQEDFPNVKFDRMPNFSLGGIDKHDFTLKKINELAPISINDFLDFMEKNYGHKSNTFLSYLMTEFGDYINGNFIDSDVIEIKDELILELKKILTEPIYSLDLVKDILKSNGYLNVDEIITKNSMYKIGYKIRSSYILRKDYDSVEEYFTELSQIKDFIPNENILMSRTYSVSIKRVEKNYDIVLISDKEFITYKKLSELGINKEMMNKFCNDVFTSFENINYFTIYNIKNMIDTTWIDDNGFDDIFYECLVETIDNIKFLRINNQKIYSFIDDNVEVEDIINEFMVEESIYVDELIDDIKEKYGIDVSSDKLIYSDKFYSRELNKLYLNKECYYKEVYNYE